MNHVVVIGGGILGLATAYTLLERHPRMQVTVIEKETAVGRHQSGRNSGVLHCGLAYAPGSLKARLAVQGIRLMTAFCRRHQLPHEICGKVVVACDPREEQGLDELARRGALNGLTGLAVLDRAALRQREPAVAASAALLVPEEGIVDYPSVMAMLAEQIRSRGGGLLLGRRVLGIRVQRGSQVVLSNGGELAADWLFNCTGLHADRTFQRLAGQPRPLRIVPFRGEYFVLKDSAQDLVRHLVYPVADPAYPFLGVHFTRMIDGGREVGPNAVLALKREGYSRSAFAADDALDALSYAGLHRFIARHVAFSVGELASSLWKSAFLAKARRLIPDLRAQDLGSGTAGVRAQAMARDGRLLMDFQVRRHGRQVHVLNAPSPGATASLALARHILDRYAPDLV